MDILIKDLNEAQQKAVSQTEGPVMAIAGAGSGKTNVLTKRIAFLINNVGVPKDQILAITFTNKAANEMKVRIAKLLNAPTQSMWISTFHSMCARILREHIEYLGYDKRFQIIDDDDTVQMIKSIQKEKGIDTKTIDPRKLKTHVMNLKSEDVNISHYKEPLSGYLNIVFPEYVKRLKENNLVDFEDLIMLTIKLFKQETHLLNHYQKLFQYILVDEFQDTNNAQYELVRLLGSGHQNVFIVGDEDQSIYAFRGANIENIRRFKSDFNDPKVILLEENYRSTNTILSAANDVIKGNKNRIEKTLFSNRGEGEKITLYKGYDQRDEVEYVAQSIASLNHSGIPYDEMAVLYRTNALSRMFEEVFMQKKLPYKIIGNTSFFKRKEIKDMVAYLRLLVNPHDNYSFERVINEPKRGIGAKTMERLLNFSRDYNLSYFEAIDDKENPLGASPLKKLKTFKHMLNRMIQTLKTASFNDLIDDLLNGSGYKEMLKQDDKGDVRFENILELKTMLKESEDVYQSDDKLTLLTYVLEDIALKSQDDENKDDHAVTLMTLHSAKGLEFKVVFIVGAEQGLFPLHRSMSDPKEIEEERRLMYVGITRAKEKLFLTNAKSRQHYGEIASNPDSMFIKQISDAYLNFEGLAKTARDNDARYRSDLKQTKAYKAKRKSLESKTENDIGKGDKIMHKVFGSGVVISVTNDQCKIAFSKEHGIKTLMKDHPAIKKVKR